MMRHKTAWLLLVLTKLCASPGLYQSEASSVIVAISTKDPKSTRDSVFSEGKSLASFMLLPSWAEGAGVSMPSCLQMTSKTLNAVIAMTSRTSSQVKHFCGCSWLRWRRPQAAPILLLLLSTVLASLIAEIVVAAAVVRALSSAPAATAARARAGARVVHRDGARAWILTGAGAGGS